MDQNNNTASPSPLEQLGTQQAPPPPPMPASPFAANMDPNTPVSLKLPVSAFMRQPTPRVQAIDTPGVRKPGGPAFLAQILDDPDKQGYIIEVRRTGPAVWENQHLPAGVVERLTPMTYNELYRRVLESHGGGEYRVLVLDENGVMKTQFPFIIDTVMTAPKVKLPNTVSMFGTAPTGLRPTPINANFAAMNGTAAETDEIAKIRDEERKTVAAHQLIRTKHELRKTEKQIMEEERAEQERRERAAQAPVDRIDQRMQQLEMLLMKTQDGGSSKTLEMMNQNFQNMMTLMMESNKQSREDAQRRSDEQFKMLTLLFSQKGSGSSEVAEAAKLAAEANKQMMTMAMETAKSGNQKFEKLFETVMVQKLTQSDNQENKAFEWMERGRRQTLELLEIRERFGDRDEDDWNPEAGVVGNVGRMVFKFLSDAMKNGGGGLLSQWIAQHTQKPTAQVTNQDLLSLAHNVEQGRIAAPPSMSQLGVNNVPAQPQIQQQYAPVTMAQPIPPAQRPIVTPSPVVPPVAPPVAINPAPVAPPVVEPVEVYEVQQPAQLVQPPAVAAVEPTAVDALVRLREYVNEALEIACADLEDARREHEWPNFALDKWPMYFLDQLLTAPDDGARVQLIQTHADPELFQRLVTLISAVPNAQHNYAMFMLALQNMLMEHRQAKVVPLNVA